MVPTNSSDDPIIRVSSFSARPTVDVSRLSFSPGHRAFSAEDAEAVASILDEVVYQVRPQLKYLIKDSIVDRYAVTDVQFRDAVGALRGLHLCTLATNTRVTEIEVILTRPGRWVLVSTKPRTWLIHESLEVSTERLVKTLYQLGVNLEKLYEDVVLNLADYIDNVAREHYDRARQLEVVSDHVRRLHR